MAESEKHKAINLFGGDKAWSSRDWTASDDRVRGGISRSYLDCSDTKIGRFCGTLDIKTLGGAGFASQRTTGEDLEWNLSEYAGIALVLAKRDSAQSSSHLGTVSRAQGLTNLVEKRYTFILKDELFQPNPEDGREQATVSYECDFDIPPDDKNCKEKGTIIFIPWQSLNATYRGKIKKGADPLNVKKIKRMSIMMRSFFGTQEGDFSLSINSISALSKAPPPNDGDDSVFVMAAKLDERFGPAPNQRRPRIMLASFVVTGLIFACLLWIR